MCRSVVFRLPLVITLALTAACDRANTPPAEKAAPQVTVITVKPQSVVIKTLFPVAQPPR